MKVICLIFLSLVATTAAAKIYPVRFNSIANFELPAAAKVILAKNSQQLVVTNCQSYLQAKQNGYAALNNSQIAAESFFITACDLGIYRQLAVSAKQSYVCSFNLKQDWQMLPVDVVFPNLAQSPEVTSEQTVWEKYPDTQILIKNQFQIELSSKAAGMRAFVNFYGLGDFNHSGFDSVLLGITRQSLTGSYQYTGFYLITRLSAAANFQVVNLPQLKYLD